jgi:hypothetical protein
MTPAATTLVKVTIVSSLDCCNSPLTGLLTFILDTLKRIDSRNAVRIWIRSRYPSAPISSASDDMQGKSKILVNVYKSVLVCDLWEADTKVGLKVEGRGWRYAFSGPAPV